MLWHSHICYQGVKGEIKMKELIIKKEKNTAATKEEFIADLDILFDELKNSYGGYEYFGEERFLHAKENILKQIGNGYSFENAVSALREEFTAFIYDGHFKVDGIPLHHRDRVSPKIFDYAVKVQETEGIPVFDIKKFYYDMEEEKEVLLEKGSNKKGSKTAENPVLIEADDKKGSKNEKTGELEKKGSTDTYTDIDIEKEIDKYINTKIKEELDKNFINNLTNCLEMKFEKVIRESFEKQLLNTVRETVTSYLSENFEETVRKCLSELLHKQSEAQQSPVLFKDYEEPKREQTPYGRYNLSLRDFKKEQTEQLEKHDIPACDNNKSGEAMPLQFNLVKQEPTPNGRASKLEEMREKYKEIEELAMRKLKQSLYHKNENGFQLLLRDTNYQLRSAFNGEHLKKAQSLIERKLRKEMERLKTA